MLFNAYYKNAIQVIVKSLFEPDSKKHAYSVLGVPFRGPVKPRRQFDHGTMVFHCQPWLTMVDCGTTMVCDRGPLLPLTMVHGQPWSENVIVNTERTCLRKGT